jgi:probable F420-dependent oxidoreductase
VEFGVTIFLTDRSIGPAELAAEAEARGFTSLFLPEHTHIPSSRRTPAPMGEPLPDEYARVLDPFVALTAAAGATSTLKLGTGICLIAQRDPFVTAKEVATLDMISGGRFVFGIGFGWNVEEIEDHGVEFPRRRALGRENTLAMMRLWQDDVASYDGEFVRFDRTWAWPKPFERSRPEILIGGQGGPVLFRHIVEYADGWMPVGARGVAKNLPVLRQMFEEAGREPSTLRVVPLGSIPEAGKLEYLRGLGITEIVLNLPSADRDTVLQVLDDHAKIVEPFRS